VSVVTEDWLYRMVTPSKGDYSGVPLNPERRNTTRLLNFRGPSAGSGGEWQGVSAAEWEVVAGARGPVLGGAMKVMTTKMKPGYLRRNGVPYSANAVVTEIL